MILARATGRWPTAKMILAIVAFIGMISTGSVRADDPKPGQSALNKVPQDVDIFNSTLRIGETIEIIGKSQAWKMIWNEPMLKEQWNKAVKSFEAGEGDFGAIKNFLAAPENKELPELLLDVVSNEFFVTAGNGTISFLELIQEMSSARWAGGFEKIFNPGEAGNDTDAQIQFILKALAQHTDKIKIPEIVIGFKVSNSEKVAKQLKRLDPLLSDALKGTPLEGRSKIAKVGKSDEFLTLSLDGSLVPWDMIPFKKYEEKDGDFAPLIKKLKSLKLNISLGVREGCLLFVIGESSEAVAKFGGEGPKLAERRELEILKKYEKKPLLGVTYVSAVLRQALATKPEDVTQYSEAAKALLQQLDVDEELGKTIQKDVDTLVGLLAKSLHKPGAVSSFSFRTPKGTETFSYDFSETSKPGESELTLLDHLGGDPILAAVWRSSTNVDDYKSVVKWLTIFGGHAEKVARAKFPDAEPIIDIVRMQLFPVLKELSEVTEKKWFPALADGQEGFVLDAKWASKQWHAAIPAADKPLPALEIGIVLGVSDAKLMMEALDSYRVVINKSLAKVQEFVPGGLFPKLEIPKPKVESKNGTTFANYPIPEEFGLDSQFLPTGGLSKDVATLTLSRKHSERLLVKTPLKEKWAPFSSAKGPIDSAFILNWSGLIDAVTPWFDYGMKMAPPGNEEGVAQRTGIAKMAINLLKIFQGYVSTTYREGGVTVTHSEARFSDIKAGPSK